MKGDLHTASLLIDRGVVFEGYCKMDSAMAANPAATIKKEPPPPPMARAQSEPPIPLTTKK